MKKGIKLAALAALVWAVLSCGQGVTAGGNGVSSSNEDEAVFTGNGFLFSYDKATDKEKKVSYEIRNVRAVFKKDGTLTMTFESYNIAEKKWVITEDAGKYSVSDAQATVGMRNMKYSYRGNTLILKSEVDLYAGGLIFILSSAHHASFLPQTDFTLSIPSE
jgi:lipoprotein